MGNCLVTKLKGSVDNSSLVKLGVLTIRFPETLPSSGVLTIGYKQTRVAFKIFNADGEELQTSYEAGAGEVAFNFANLNQNASYIEVYDIYNVVKVNCNTLRYDKNIASCLSLEYFSAGYSSSVGVKDISELPNTLEMLLVPGTNVEGSTDIFDRCEDLILLDVQFNTNIVGSLEEVGEILYSNYTTDKSVEVRIARNVTLNGNKPNGTFVISATSGQVTIKQNDVVKATYNGSTWTYA
jgi:hypothetical protein